MARHTVRHFARVGLLEDSRAADSLSRAGLSPSFSAGVL
jgi:hypothetical protein